MFPYVEEQFSAQEADILRRYFTNLDKPVFALVNLPEVVKGALFARYSRSAKSLRRLFLDEFVGELDVSGDAGIDATVGLERAESLYDKVFLEYGDDSVAQLGGVHLACEQASNLLTKVLERGRLMAYLEQSTRYIGYDARMPSGHYRYYRDPDVLDSPLGARYVGDMDRMFDTYARLLPQMQTWLHARFPRRHEDSDFAHRQAVKARALDALRGLLPAGSLSNLGIYGTGQSYEALLLRMRSHPLPEARRYSEMMLSELRKVIPSFLQRVDRPERGGEWVSYLTSTRQSTEQLVGVLLGDPQDARDDDQPGHLEARGPVVELVEWDPDGELEVLAGICYPHCNYRDADLIDRVRRLGADEREALLRAYVGARTNRRHRPGRAFERTWYRFDVVSDYGAFRDLQRHRMLTIEWQRLGTRLGWSVPELVEEAGLAGEYSASMQRSAALVAALADVFPEQSSYAAALGFRIRYSIQMNAREAMHLIELRSGEQGHPEYRSVALQMHDLIANRAGHHALARAMSFVDRTDPELGRLEAERRAEQKRANLALDG